MIQAERKYWFVLLAVAVIGVFLIAMQNIKESRAQQKRETEYQIILAGYSGVLKPGMAREEVEGYFRSNKTLFRQMCCVDHRSVKRSWDDVVKVGQEAAPWFCDAKNIYVAFQFSDAPAHDDKLGGDPSDKLTAITLYPWLERCL